MKLYQNLLWIQLKIKKIILKVLKYLKKFMIFIKEPDYQMNVQELVKFQDQIRKKIHLKRVMKKIMKIMGKLKKNKMNKKIMKKKILKIKRVKLKMKMQMNKKFKKNLKMI